MVWDHEVGGSNPLTPTIMKLLTFAEAQKKLDRKNE
jgi:hypothetical protein